MAKVSVDILARNLARLLKELVSLHGELASLMQEKIEAIKRADSDRIQAITAREMALVERATERDGLRRQITRRIVAGLELDAGAEHDIRLTELAEHFREPLRSQLLVAASGLKLKVRQVERQRLTTMLVTEAMIVHLREIMAVMTGGGVDPELYSRCGKRQAPGSANVFEAVG